jgi:hypothetical protein
MVSTKNFTPQRLTPTEAAAYIGSTPKTLAKWRSTGRHSIPYLKFGTGKRASVRYDRNDLDAFLTRCREHGSGINTFDINEKRD